MMPPRPDPPADELRVTRRAGVQRVSNGESLLAATGDRHHTRHGCGGARAGGGREARYRDEVAADEEGRPEGLGREHPERAAGPGSERVDGAGVGVDGGELVAHQTAEGVRPAEVAADVDKAAEDVDALEVAVAVDV